MYIHLVELLIDMKESIDVKVGISFVLIIKRTQKYKFRIFVNTVYHLQHFKREQITDISKCCIATGLVSVFLEEVPSIIQEASSVLTNWG